MQVESLYLRQSRPTVELSHSAIDLTLEPTQDERYIYSAIPECESDQFGFGLDHALLRCISVVVLLFSIALSLPSYSYAKLRYLPYGSGNFNTTLPPGETRVINALQ